MPFLYTSCVLDYALRFLMIFLLLIKKKIKPPGPKTLSMDKYTNEVTKVALGMPIKDLLY
jgi:hypothetical protein